jgi:hypothetical protein
MSDITIDHDIPVPLNARTCKYPIADLAVGDSFFAPSRTPKELQGTLVHWRRKLGTRYMARKVDGGARVWRVG